MIVKIKIKKQLHRDYLNYLFSQDNNGNYIVSRRHDLGKLICSMVRYSSYPVSEAHATSTISLLLPAAHCLSTAAKSYLFFSEEDQEKLNDHIDALFNIDFDRYYLEGKKLKMQQKEIIHAFIISRQLIYLIGDNETLKKRAYRDELKQLKKYTEMLNTKAYNRHNRIKNISV